MTLTQPRFKWIRDVTSLRSLEETAVSAVVRDPWKCRNCKSLAENTVQCYRRVTEEYVRGKFCEYYLVICEIRRKIGSAHTSTHTRNQRTYTSEYILSWITYLPTNHPPPIFEPSAGLPYHSYNIRHFILGARRLATLPGPKRPPRPAAATLGSTCLVLLRHTASASETAHGILPSRSLALVATLSVFSLPLSAFHECIYPEMYLCSSLPPLHTAVFSCHRMCKCLDYDDDDDRRLL